MKCAISAPLTVANHFPEDSSGLPLVCQTDNPPSNTY